MPKYTVCAPQLFACKYLVEAESPEEAVAALYGAEGCWIANLDQAPEEMLGPEDGFSVAVDNESGDEVLLIEPTGWVIRPDYPLYPLVEALSEIKQKNKVLFEILSALLLSYMKDVKEPENV